MMSKVEPQGNNGLKKLSLTILDEILDEHSNWLASGRRAGIRTNLSRSDLRGVNLENRNLRWANLSNLENLILLATTRVKNNIVFSTPNGFN